MSHNNLLRALIAISGIKHDSLIFDPLKKYIEESKAEDEKVFPYGKLYHGVLYFNSPNAVTIFSNLFKSKFTEPLISTKSRHVSQARSDVRAESKINTIQTSRETQQRAIAATNRLHQYKQLEDQK